MPGSSTGKPAITEAPADEPRGPYEPYWRSGEGGRLTLPRCASCGHVFWPPSDVCPECLSDAVEWDEVDGRGTVWSVAVYHRAYTPALADEVPYQCILVELDCGPRMISRFASKGAARAVPGQRVIATRAKLNESRPPMPCFQED
jgi:uncharacterized OB-fold protein